MIYLIKSASWNKEENRFEFILKIGYTKDSSAQNRFSSYVNHNPTSEILFKIQNATRRQEGSLHNYFKDFRVYGKEWYKYDDGIVEFFKEHTTAESLDLLPKYKFQREIESNRTISLNKFSEFIKGINDSNLKERLQTYLSLKTHYLRLKFLCDLAEEGLLTNEILEYLPDNNFKIYFELLGYKRIKELGHNIFLLNKELNINLFDKSILKGKIFENFKVSEKYSLSDIKDKLREIYTNVGYSKNPMPKDLEEFFDIKEITMYVLDDFGAKKRARGYEILSKKQ